MVAAVAAAVAPAQGRSLLAMMIPARCWRAGGAAPPGAVARHAVL